MDRLLFVLPICALSLAACQGDKPTQAEAKPLAELIAPPSAQVTPPASGATQGQAPVPAQQLMGTVVETMDAGDYTYVKLDAESAGEIWAAGPGTQVAVGDTVRIAGAMQMKAFESKTLSRTFEDIYFASVLQVVGKDSGTRTAPKALPVLDATPAMKIEKAEGGQTIAEVFEGADTLSGREVVVRGQVVKFNSAILDTNWLHIRDGSGAAGTNDLTVTTDDTAEVGDVIVIRGQLATNKDFGAGYSYPVIIEGASITP